MADRVTDDADRVVDEMKRKARRRLVGAIVLALAAAIILPMLLEKEPRPLGDDVSVQIPPVDEGKFINRLTGKSGDARPLPKVGDKADPKVGQGKPEPKPEAAAPVAQPQTTAPPTMPPPSEAPVPRKSVAEAEQRALSPSSKPPARTDAKPAAAPEPKAAAKPAAAAPGSEPGAPAAQAQAEPTRIAAEPKAALAEPKPAVEGKPEPKSATGEPRPASAAAAQAAPPGAAAAPAKAEGYVVQLAAFADDKGANALANRLKKAGYAAYVEPVQTSRGTLWRVRVGGYGSRPEADAARAALKGEGYSGIVAPAK